MLSGSFSIETVGVAQFASGAMITSPMGAVTDPWPASGYAWNNNIGWIDLSHVAYNPLTQAFE